MFSVLYCDDGVIRQLGPFPTEEEAKQALADAVATRQIPLNDQAAYIFDEQHRLLICTEDHVRTFTTKLYRYCQTCGLRAEDEEFLPTDGRSDTYGCTCCGSSDCFPDTDPPEIRLAHMVRQRGIVRSQLMELLDIDPERMHNPSIEDVLTFSLENDDPDWVEEQICLHERIGKWKTK